MNIRFLRIFIFLMCAFTTGIVNAHTLHVGNKTFALSQTKYTTPSLAFGVGNEVWYGTLTISPLTDTLHIKHDNKTYSLCEPFTDTENYTYDANGRLIGANENLYIEGTGKQFIDTTYYANTNTTMTIKFLLTNTKKSHMIAGTPRYAVQTVNSTKLGYRYNSNLGTQLDVAANILQPYLVEFKKNEFYVDGILRAEPRLIQFTDTNPINVFGYKNILSTNPNNGAAKIFFTTISEDNVLIHHFVPVPACMRVGDFVVPENGMWDIVEQKFYGNSGSGSFIYGKDE